MPYLISVIDVYELVLKKPSTHRGSATDKVKQEILHGLGNILTFILLIKILCICIPLGFYLCHSHVSFW